MDMSTAGRFEGAHYEEATPSRQGLRFTEDWRRPAGRPVQGAQLNASSASRQSSVMATAAPQRRRLAAARLLTPRNNDALTTTRIVGDFTVRTQPGTIFFAALALTLSLAAQARD